MEYLTFEQLVYMCEQNKHKQHVALCLDLLTNQTCIFIDGIREAKGHIADLYRFRYEMVMEQASVTTTYLTDFENCVKQLEQSTSPLLGITDIIGDSHSYLIFYEPDTNDILGVLVYASVEGIAQHEAYVNDVVAKGYSCSGEKYEKGILIMRYE